MDAYEATRVVFSRIQALDPDNAAKIMGLLLIQDHGEKEMIRLAFGPESLVHSVVLKARKDLGLVPPTSNPSTPSAGGSAYLSRQNSARLLPPPPPLTVSSPSWAPTPALHNPFSRSNGLDDTPDDLINGGGGADLIDELQLQDQLSFLNDPAQIGPKGGDFFYPDDSPYSMGGYHRRSCSAADLCLSPDAAAGGFGWKPCLYFARGYCKNGATCRFLHGLPDDSPTAGKIDSVVDQQCHELLLRSKSQRLMASAFPFSPTGSVSVPPSPSSTKCMNFLLQQQSESQRAAAAAAAAAALMLGGDDGHKFMGRARMERADFAGMVNPGSRQIYLTFPADSTFREEDVSNYFSIYGPVQDVRIPYQQKRMFGFVTFVYPETVKLILAKGNPHFVCDARVLVKPYKEKGKVPDKYRKQQQQAERGDFSGCTTPTSLDSRDNPYDLGSRMLYGGSNQDLLLRRKLEEQQQQQAAELQQAIELQGRRFMGLHLLDFKARSLSSPSSSSSSATAFLSSNSATNSTTSVSPPTSTTITIPSLEDSSPPEDKSPSPASAASSGDAGHGFLQQVTVNASSAAVAPADKEESSREASPNEVSDFQESAEHNLPDSPFASPTKASFTADSAFHPDSAAPEPGSSATVLPRNGSNGHLITSTLDMASFKSCFYQMPRFPSGHGAVGM